MKRWLGPVQILLDTNIIVSGLISGNGPPRQLLWGWQQEKFVLVTSFEQIAELARVVGYGRLRQRIDPRIATRTIKTMSVVGHVVPDARPVNYSPDPDDNIILATAIAGGADLIVSGDKRDMLALGQVGGIRIVTARGAVEQLKLI